MYLPVYFSWKRNYEALVEECENYKMKNYGPNWDSNQLPPAYETGALTDFTMEPFGL